ncbi:hypothetical protein QYF36_011294 [Acer negundo]|nr:hypothetical protein QYF36_011294 [Acer negundo]
MIVIVSWTPLQCTPLLQLKKKMSARLVAIEIHDRQHLMDPSPVHTTPPVEEEDEWGILQNTRQRKCKCSLISARHCTEVVPLIIEDLAMFTPHKSSCSIDCWILLRILSFQYVH